MSFRGIIKGILGVVISFGAGLVIEQIVEHNMTPIQETVIVNDANGKPVVIQEGEPKWIAKAKEVAINVSLLALTGVISGAACTYAYEAVDDVADMINHAKKK